MVGGSKVLKNGTSFMDVLLVYSINRGEFNNHVDKRREFGGQSNVHEFPSWVPRWSMKSPRGQKQNKSSNKLRRKDNIETVIHPLKLSKFIKIKQFLF